MSRRSLARSLYWRIGFGFIFFLAITLSLQVALFLWVAGETEGGMPERMGRDFAELVASEFEAALARDPTIDLHAYAERRVKELHRPAAIIFPDGTSVAPPGTEVPRGMRMPFRRRGDGGGRDRGGPDGPGDRRGPPPFDGRGGPPPDGRGGPPPDGGGMSRMFGPPRRGPVMAPIEQNDAVVAIVWVPPLTGLRRFADTIGTPLAFGVLLLLIAGTAIAALVIFRPAQARLRALEDAANRFGEGDLTARAPAIGGDEVAAVAEAFNRMAGDLAARQAQLVEADRARRQLLADVSHELMTPLTAIRGYAETLALPQFVPSTKEGQRAVKVIQEEGERIERLVKDLLDLARFEAGGISLEQENVDVDEIFERVSERHAKTAQDKGVEIVIDPHEDDIRMVGDPMRLEQALQNLAANALRHTAPGGKVRLGAARANGRITLTVTDSGVGIPAEHLPHVFDRFYKADQSRLHAGGSGLGLSIVKAIVERHGGTVAARSDQGVATVFEIVLPERLSSGALPYDDRSSIEKMP
ncbi:MAG TPA: HAMP domain-containing sensor histidine kinase [Vicinamibacterales bacterium]|nr:HAMP domain-containing sensor histidine kinase [Vicinamibacterales bacterium]